MKIQRDQAIVSDQGLLLDYKRWILHAMTRTAAAVHMHVVEL